MNATTGLDIRTDGVDGAAAGCAPGACTKAFALWSVWEAAQSQRIVVLGDLSRFVPLSGYRLRLVPQLRAESTDGSVRLVVVGSPQERVWLGYLERNAAGHAWILREALVVVGSEGREEALLG